MHPRKNAFTFIVTLVVISIITLLIALALLIPACAPAATPVAATVAAAPNEALLIPDSAPAATMTNTVYFVRHAQCLSNVQKGGSATTFTPGGEKQVQSLTTALQTLKFDFIAVSPAWRTRHTILPYLKATGQVAEIWPELIETGKNDPAQTEFPKDPPSATLFEGGALIVLPDEEKPFFRLRQDGSGQKMLNSSNPADAQALARKTEELIRARFGLKDATILLVGHGNSSIPLLRQLMNNPSFTNKPLENTCLWVLREQTGDSFMLEHYNKGPRAMFPELFPKPPLPSLP